MEEKLNLILEKLTKIEGTLNNVKDESCKEYLEQVKREDLIGVNIDLIYNAYKDVTNGNASLRELNSAIRKTFGLRVRVSSKNKKTFRYWGE